MRNPANSCCFYCYMSTCISAFFEPPVLNRDSATLLGRLSLVSSPSTLKHKLPHTVNNGKLKINEH